MWNPAVKLMSREGSQAAADQAFRHLSSDAGSHGDKGKYLGRKGDGDGKRNILYLTDEMA